MMNNILEYKGYHAKIEFISETKTLRGKIDGINDYVDFETANIAEIEKEFHDAVDDYIAFCEEVGKDPEKEYKGTFNVRISPNLHRQLATLSFKEDCSLNAIVEKACEFYVCSNRVHSLGEMINHYTVVLPVEKPVVSEVYPANSSSNNYATQFWNNNTSKRRTRYDTKLG